jgi:flagellar motor switch protein FliN/FliY
MADASLSQSEIDALLQGADGFDMGGAPAAGAKADPKKGGLTAKELASAGKVAETIATAQAAALFSAVNQTATFEVSSAKVTPLRETASGFDGQVLVAKTTYTQPASGIVFYLFKEEDARTIAGLSLGSPVDSLDDNAINALQEVLAQMTGNADTDINNNHGIDMASSSPKALVADAGKLNIPDGDYWTVHLTLNLEGTLDSSFVQLYPLPLAKALSGAKGGRSDDRAPAGGGGLDALLEGSPASSSSPVSSIQNAEFSPLVQTADPAITGNINLLLDVPLEVTVELGRSTKTVQEVLSLGEGSIIELDKLAGEPVDLLVNGKPIAKGEVVVIDENFGVRVTEIVNLKSRLNPEE